MAIVGVSAVGQLCAPWRSLRLPPSDPESRR